MLKVGIIGCGMIAKMRHAPEYAACRDVVLDAWYDAVPERAQALASQYGGRVYNDWRSMIEHGNLDAVSICSPNICHAEHAVYALEHGLHVLCEKPMATSLEECARMVQASKCSGRLLFIGQNQRLAPAHIKARRLIEEGVIGRPLTFQTAFGHCGPEVWTQTSNTWFYSKETAAFGAMFDLGIHKVDILCYLLGEPITAVCAMMGTLDKKDSEGQPIGVEDNAVCVLRTRSGMLGQMAASWTYYGSEVNATRIYGSKGALHIFEDPDHPLIFQNGERKQYYEVAHIQTNKDQFESGVISAFVEDVRRGGPARISGESVYQSMWVVFAAIESARTGKLVEV